MIKFSHCSARSRARRRFYADGSVVVARRILALLPISWRRYRREELEGVQTFSGSYSMSGDADHSVTTIWLCNDGGPARRGAVVFIGRRQRTPVDVPRRILREKFALPVH